MKHALAIAATAVALSAVVANVLVAEEKTEPVTLTDARGMRFCEFLLISETEVVIYNTSGSPAGCPAGLFDSLQTDTIVKDHGVRAAKLNGPKFWAMDEQTLGLGETKSFGGIDARYAATLPIASLGSGDGADPYAPYVTEKEQKLTFRAGQPIFELVDAGGNIYVLNAYGAKVKDHDPANLADQLAPIDGWAFRTRTPEEDLIIIQKGDAPSKMVGDEFHQYYSFEASGG
ncbi:hypothetical protein [Sedimentitalea sp.]|uniref:hypothetical protein n=1 Tax=Sedimentitalea sp. TaxID=2048915 RepID=UPI0032994E4F